MIDEAWAGSSPLTRGKHLLPSDKPVRGRLIPAHAGKTRAQCLSGAEQWAHPRSCGENPGMPGGTYVDEGSSPLTQGKLLSVPLEPFIGGLIPAHAEKTSADRSRDPYRRAHPRTRGENTPPGYRTPPGVGSSPHTRGKQTARLILTAVIGLIPAHAGKTRTHRRTHSRLTAHPHSCGENRPR